MNYDGDMRLLGWGTKEVLKVQNWLRMQNAKLEDLDNAGLDFNYWPRQRLHAFLREDFK